MKWFKRSDRATNGAGSAPASVKIISVADHVSERSVYFFPGSAPKEEILFRLIGSLELPDHAAALNAVLEREKAGGTVLDPDISLPHARLKGLAGIQLAIGIRSDSSAPAGEPKLFFLFLGPKEDTKTHLFFLSSLSSLFQTEGFVDNMLGAKASYQVVQKIREMEKGL